MSLAAQVWANGLPLDVGLNYAAYRVLGKLADAHHADTGMAYRHVDRVATELRCSKRTVQRALKDLQLLGFIHRGDQHIVGHIDVRYRPTVFTLALDLWQPQEDQPELPGMGESVTPEQPVDNSDSGVTPAVTPPDPGVTDTPQLGVTTVVAHRTGSRTSNKYPAQPQTARGHEHHFRTVRDTLDEPVGQFCADTECGLRDDGRKRIDWSEMAIRPVRRAS